MLRYPILAIAVICFTASAGAISRSGGGRLESADLGFSTLAPTNYVRTNPVANSGLRLWSNQYLPGQSTVSSDTYLEVRDYQFEFQEFKLLDRQQTEAGFTKLAWLKAAHGNACVDLYRRESATISATAIVWGSGRGIVVLGGTSTTAKEAIDEIVNALVVTSGKCGW